MNDKNEGASFNRQNEQEGMQDASRDERNTTGDEFSKTSSDLSEGDSARNFGEVSGTTFGMESNTAKFSNIGPKNQARKGEANEGNNGNMNNGNM